MRVAAIVPAAGKGRRIKSRIQKPYIELCGKPILAHTLLRLSSSRLISEVVVAIDAKKVATFKRDIISKFRIKKIKVVNGGKERLDSVYNALQGLSDNIDYILVHDGIRPFITVNLIRTSLRAEYWKRATYRCYFQHVCQSSSTLQRDSYVPFCTHSQST